MDKFHSCIYFFRVLFHNKMDVLGEIEARIKEADDCPSPKTSNKVCLVFSSLNKSY